MEANFSDTKPTGETRMECLGKDRVRVKREALQAALEQCRRALESLNTTGFIDDDEKDSGAEVESTGSYEDRCLEGSPSTRDDRDDDELRGLLKSGFESPAFLGKLQCAQASNSRITTEEGYSWDMVSENDLWKGEDIESDQDCYVLVRQEDIAEGMACFMAAYLLSLDHTKDLTPNQLQKVLSKTFSVKKKKGKLQKAWDGSKVIYNVASWGATAIGIYQNPVIIRAATTAFWRSCHVISKLL